MTEFLIVIAVIDLLVFAGLWTIMRAGGQADRSATADARALWSAQQQGVRRAAAVAASGAVSSFAGRRVIDGHGTRLGVAGGLLVDALDASPQWVEVQVRGFGADRPALVPAEGLRVGMSEVQVSAIRHEILKSPFVSEPLTRDGELMLCRHYGLGRRSVELYGRAPGEVTAATAAVRGVAGAIGA